jgi:hypothetical protein
MSLALKGLVALNGLASSPPLLHVSSPGLLAPFSPFPLPSSPPPLMFLYFSSFLLIPSSTPPLGSEGVHGRASGNGLIGLEKSRIGAFPLLSVQEEAASHNCGLIRT